MDKYAEGLTLITALHLPVQRHIFLLICLCITLYVCPMPKIMNSTLHVLGTFVVCSEQAEENNVIARLENAEIMYFTQTINKPLCSAASPETTTLYLKL